MEPLVVRTISTIPVLPGVLLKPSATPLVGRMEKAHCDGSSSAGRLKGASGEVAPAPARKVTAPVEPRYAATSPELITTNGYRAWRCRKNAQA